MRIPAARLAVGILSTGLLAGLALAGSVRASSTALGCLGLGLLAGLPASWALVARIREPLGNAGVVREHRALRVQSHVQRGLAVIAGLAGAWSLWEGGGLPGPAFLHGAGLLVVPALAAAGLRLGLDRSLPTAPLEWRRACLALGGALLILGAALGLTILPRGEALATLLLAIWLWLEGQAAAQTIALPKVCCGGCGGGCR